MDNNKKQDLLNKNAEKYKTMNSDKKQDLSNKNAKKYKTMVSGQRGRWRFFFPAPKTFTVTLHYFSISYCY